MDEGAGSGRPAGRGRGGPPGGGRGPRMSDQPGAWGRASHQPGGGREYQAPPGGSRGGGSQRGRRGMGLSHPGDRNGSPGHARVHQPPGQQVDLDSAKREQGVVVTTRDSYGFIRLAERNLEVFFHMSEVHTASPTPESSGKHDLEQLIAIGTEVECVVLPNPKSDRPIAKAVKVLPKGTLATEEIGTQMLLGEITHACEATGRRGSSKDNATGMLKVTSVPEGDSSEAQLQGPTATVGQNLSFELGEVQGNTGAPHVGSEVKFRVCQHGRSRQRKAVQVELVKSAVTAPSAAGQADTNGAAATNERETGVVVTLKESFGFIQSTKLHAPQAFFHFSELRDKGKRPSIGTAVAYSMQYSERTKKEIAMDVEILPDGTLLLGPPQTVRGFVNIVSAGSTGMLLFRDSDMIEHSCSYSDEMVTLPKGEDSPLKEDDEVEFEAHLNLQTGNYSASKVRLLRRASASIEYGQIQLIKNNFGFIKCCSRTTDVFFHLSSLKGGLNAETIKVGTGVQFGVIRDPKTGKLNAVNVSAAPPEMVVFETVGDEVHGVVLERNFTNKAAGSSGTMVGIIEYIEASGGKSRITFSGSEVEGMLPKPMDPVAFRVTSNLRAMRDAMNSNNPTLAARRAQRATHVTVIRHTGVVATLRPSFGFIEYKLAPVNVKDLPSSEPAGPPPGLGLDSSGPDSAAPAEPTTAAEDQSVQPTPGEARPDSTAAASASHQVPAATDSKTQADVSATCGPAQGGPSVDEARAQENATGGDNSAGSQEEGGADGAKEAAGAAPAEPPAGDAQQSAGDRRGDRKGKHAPGRGRIFFHISEVQDDVQLNLRDEVELTAVMNPKTNEVNARHVVRTKEAPQRPVLFKKRPEDDIYASATAAKHVPIRPGAPVKHQGVRQPLMPDDTRGFTMGRGKGLEGIVHPPLGLRAPPPPEPKPEPEPEEKPTRIKKNKQSSRASTPTPDLQAAERTDSITSLSADALPFVPHQLSESLTDPIPQP